MVERIHYDEDRSHESSRLLAPQSHDITAGIGSTSASVETDVETSIVETQR